IPAGRMKGRKEHRIPLTDRVLELLNAMKIKSQTAFVFAGDDGLPIGPIAMRRLIARMGHGDLTVHGFRSTFRDWAGEQTSFAREVIEHALAHRIKDRSEEAYARSDLLEKRRQLMDDWAAFCAP